MTGVKNTGYATVACKWCNTPTKMLGTRECDRCHDLRVRIDMDLVLAEEMLRQLKQEAAWNSVIAKGPV